MPHNICNKCHNRLTEFKTFRDYCLKNDELIRLHSLIHDEGDDSTRPDVESVNDDNGEDLQDIDDYVRDELQEELNLKGGGFGISSSIEAYAGTQNVRDDGVDVDGVEIDHIFDDQALVLLERKGEQSRETSSEMTVEAYTECAEEIDMGGIVSNIRNKHSCSPTYVIIFPDWHKHRNFGRNSYGAVDVNRSRPTHCLCRNGHDSK